jgi:ribosomal protein S18 acetylase RimI-like enzyme
VKLRLEVEEPLSDASRRALIDELVAFQTESFGPPHFTEFGYFLRDEQGKLRAGICGRFRWGWLYVEMLWVDASLRGQGHGTELLRMAEDFARSRAGVAVHLENGTDALPFYQKRGYEVVGSMEGYPTGHSRYYLRKWLARRPEAGVV